MTSHMGWYPEGPLCPNVYLFSNNWIGGATPGELDNNERFAPDTRIKYTRWFSIGEGDVGSVIDHFYEVQVRRRAPFKAMSLKKGQCDIK